VHTYDHVKHLLVDEMQDYTPIQYSVLSRLFKCRKTILGDVRQTVNPYSASTTETIERVFPLADTVKLFRSYRSTLEIASFAQRISPNPDLVVMERHGEQPEVKGFKNNEEELVAMRAQVETFLQSQHHTLGILCKTLQQATFVYQELNRSVAHLLTDESTSYQEGIVITTVHLSKGLEFDEVIIPFVSARNYHTEMDRSMLYIACTRAMHKLTITHSDVSSAFIR
jgi:DNA helicase-2/ATP-dependent DNA helicase PcrA